MTAERYAESAKLIVACIIFAFCLRVCDGRAFARARLNILHSSHASSGVTPESRSAKRDRVSFGIVRFPRQWLTVL